MKNHSISGQLLIGWWYDVWHKFMSVRPILKEIKHVYYCLESLLNSRKFYSYFFMSVNRLIYTKRINFFPSTTSLSKLFLFDFRLLSPHPNAYTYSKRLAEAVIAENHPQLPCVIVRPSIGQNFN